MPRGKGKGRAAEILRAEVSDVRQIATILRTVNIRSETKATVTVQDDGLSFNVEIGQSVLARAHLHYQNNFRTYSYTPPAEKPARGGDSHSDQEDDEQDGTESPRFFFEISLSALLNCINIFGESSVKPISAQAIAAKEAWRKKQRRERNGYDDDNNGDMDDDEGGARYGNQARAGSTITGSKKKGVTAMVMTWKAEGCPLVLELEEDGIVTRCEITTFEAGEIFELPYDDSERLQKLILNASWLAEALSEIDPSCERLYLSFAPPHRGQNTSFDEEADDDDERETARESAGGRQSKAAFSLEATGNSGSVRMDYPFTKEVLEVCECERPLKNGYKFSHLAIIRTALTHSTKASLRTDASGCLSMQFMIVSVKGDDDLAGAGFVEFTCMPLNDED